jgi:acetylserotonin N-methyltransferase
MKYELPGTDDRRIWDLFLTTTHQAAVTAADQAGVFSALAEKPATIAELADRLDFDHRATGILLRLLAALGLLAQRTGQFQLTNEARTYMVPSSAFYWGHMMKVAASEFHVKTLLSKLRRKGSDRAVGPEGTPLVSGEGRASDGWAAGNVSSEQARATAAGMHSHSLPAAVGAAHSYEFKNVRRILDVGGGSGCFMIAMAQQHPHLRCTIMELPAMCEVAEGYIRNGEVADRVDTFAVDMFRQPWPKRYDALFFSNVWHDWNVQTCKWLAARAFEALPPGGRIMLHEILLDDDGAGPVTAAAFSMLMLVGTQGQQFTFDELREILESAGFKGIEAQPTYGYYSIVTGYKS